MRDFREFGGWKQAECLVVLGDKKHGLAIAHIDLTAGDKTGHAGTMFSDAYSLAAPGHNGLGVIVAPNDKPKTDAVMFNNFTAQRPDQPGYIFGDQQCALGLAVRAAEKNGGISEANQKVTCMTFSSFLHGGAGKKLSQVPTGISDAIDAAVASEREELGRHIFLNNFAAAMGAIGMAYGWEPKFDKWQPSANPGHPIITFDWSKLPSEWWLLGQGTWDTLKRNGAYD